MHSTVVLMLSLLLLAVSISSSNAQIPMFSLKDPAAYKINAQNVNTIGNDDDNDGKAL
jgi:hypothetical protein